CGLLYDGRIDVVGLEAVRGDWSELAKEVQEKVIEIILKENSPAKAVRYVQNVIKDLKSQKIPLSKLIIWKTVTKNIDEYEVTVAHVVAAKKLLASGYPLTVGDKVGYIVVKRPGLKLADKVEPYIFVKDYSDIDIDYYINKQIVPVATRILNFFGYDEKQILAGTRQASLSDFF
ncbi:MAG TPA: DNA polymerase II, partial [Thermoprotei archaeon]|nr:DNA polymerase II [Thermoprotei archaeon]